MPSSGIAPLPRPSALRHANPAPIKFGGVGAEVVQCEGIVPYGWSRSPRSLRGSSDAAPGCWVWQTGRVQCRFRHCTAFASYEMRLASPSHSATCPSDTDQVCRCGNEDGAMRGHCTIRVVSLSPFCESKQVGCNASSGIAPLLRATRCGWLRPPTLRFAHLTLSRPVRQGMEIGAMQGHCTLRSTVVLHVLRGDRLMLSRLGGIALGVPLGGMRRISSTPVVRRSRV